MILRRFNESFKDFHTVDTDDIGDYALELVEMGYKLDISKGFICGEKRTKEPTEKKSIPYYRIVFSKLKLESDPVRMYGSYYFDDDLSLNAFTLFIKRLKRWGYVRWFINNTNYYCELYLDEVNTEVGFDFSDFYEKFKLCLLDIRLEHNLNINTWSSWGGGSVMRITSADRDDIQSILDTFLKKYSKWIEYKLIPKNGRYKTLSINIKEK